MSSNDPLWVAEDAAGADFDGVAAFFFEPCGAAMRDTAAMRIKSHFENRMSSPPIYSKRKGGWDWVR
jgi:hypothetical protein